MTNCRLMPALFLLAWLAGMPGAADAATRPQPRCSAPIETRAMTYNIRLDTPADGPNQWQYRRALVVAQIELARPEILGFQEVLPVQRADLATALKGYTLLGGGRDDGRSAGEASPLAIDRKVYRVVSSGMFWLSETPSVPSLGWDAAYRRVASWAHLVRRADGARVLAVNTHWDHLGAAAREGSARQLGQWLKANKGKGEAAILIGDFNAPLGEASLQHLLHGAGGGLALRDARAAAGASATGTAITFNGFDPQPRAGETIDHILVAGGIAVRRYHVLAEHFDGRVASDHFPVIADLALACRS